MSTYHIRVIEAKDNPQVAEVITDVMTSFGCVGEGYSSSDPEVKNMHKAYADDRSIFYVVTDGEKVIGCGGIAQLSGAENDTCELRKMYFTPTLRGLGYGKKLLELCIAKATEIGYKKCYIETTNRMVSANHLYKKYGFKELDSTYGNTGHNGCDAFYIKEL